MRPSIILSATILILLVIGIPSFLYWKQFHGNGLSESQEVWGQLGDFLNVWVSSASLILLSTLTYYIHFADQQATERHRNEEIQAQANRDELEKIKNRPALIFKVDRTKNKWRVKNVGAGAAFNIQFSYCGNDNVWYQPLIKIYSLAPGDSFLIKRHIQPMILGAVYFDIHSNVISSMCQSDDTDIHIGVNSFEHFDHRQYTRLEDWEADRFSSTSPHIQRPTPTPTPTPTMTPYRNHPTTTAPPKS